MPPRVRTTTRTDRYIDRLIGASTVAAVAFAVTLNLWGDRSGFGMLLLFAPRHWLLAPWALLLPLGWAVAWRTRSWRPGAVASFGTVVTAFWVALVEVPLPWRPRPAGATLRLVTWNTDGAPLAELPLRRYLEAWNAEVVLLQDCSAETAGSARALRQRWWVLTTPEFCVLSRLPASGAEAMPEKGRPASDWRRALRFRVRTAVGPVTIVAVHLGSPRDALAAALRGDFSRLASDVERRSLESAQVAAWVYRSVVMRPVVVAGDFNLPYGSATLRRDWDGFRNAWSDAGVGIGHTMFAGRHHVRIDHVLLSSDLAARSAAVLRGYPADHQPVLVEFGWRHR